MGEIGINRLEYLYEIRWWELVLIYRGYARRHRENWSMMRWQTFQLMGAQAGKKGMNEAGLFKPTDLLEFPWEKEASIPLTDADRQQLQAEMDAFNKANNTTATTLK